MNRHDWENWDDESRFKYEIKRSEEIDPTKNICEFPGCGDPAQVLVEIEEVSSHGRGTPYAFCLWHRERAIEYHQECLEEEEPDDGHGEPEDK